MITLYARQEPTNDDTAIKQLKNSPRELEGLKDACLYNDKDCKSLKVRIPWHHKEKPFSRKTVTLNCSEFAIEWVDPLEYTRVIFRRQPKDHEILALFPDLSEGGALIESYRHIGQHGGADYSHCMRQSIPARPDEYADLKAELEGIGYNLLIRKRR